MCFISLSTFFQPYNYGQLSGNSAFGQVALKWFSNAWCKLQLYSYGMCASRNNSDKTVHMHRQINYATYYLFNEWQLFISWFNLLSFLVYIMWCTVLMHIQNWNDSPITMLRWATIGPPLHSNEWVQLLLMLCCCCHWARMRACGCACVCVGKGEVRSMVWHINTRQYLQKYVLPAFTRA